MSHLYAARGDEPIFEIEESDRVLILKMVEDPSASNYRSRQFEYNRLQKQIGDNDIQYLVFDLSLCRFLDSITVGILISLTTAVRNRNGDAVMVGANPDVSDLLCRLMLIEPEGRRAVWTSYPSRRHAIEALISENN
ncbi:STAS domain-containing protein [bacterium]|nr:STAS domain-containing protein [bacterium]